ncbi:TraB/GumN family protein [Altericroceibacterium xinjiangense]|uniref:TraB/GumN family protein n=1 Tax=Altericroceibacterium xinjiangense TaxID=762261 RepID=UPI000F7F1D62|nr:TraB/GumN family protein [Altericroceibacterium xinjiangense]
MNGRRVIERFLFFAAAFLLAACGGPREDWPPPSPALWEVTGPDGAKGWLFGTVHALPSSVAWQTQAVEQALRSADRLVVEIANLGRRDAARAAFDEVARTPGLPPLSARVPASDRAALHAFMERAGRDDDDFTDLETWAAALRLANAARRSDGGEGVDTVLLEGKDPVVGLESYAAQYRVFDTLTPSEQATLLLGLARDAELDANEGRLRAWVTGDLDELARQSSVGILTDPGLREKLLSARNRNWASRIDAMLKSGARPFVAVGAAHMLWDDGLPALLTQRGYTVTRVE